VKSEAYLVKWNLKVSDTFFHKPCYLADTLLAGLRVLGAVGESRSPNFVGILPYFRAKVNKNAGHF